MANHTIDKFTYDGETYILQDNTSGYITDAGVTSFNGNTGAITYTAPVTSVNGDTGAVTVSVPSASTTTPSMDGTGSYGSGTSYARSNHVHPTDTSRASSTHTHGDITNGGDITNTATIASGDRIVINDESASKITNSSITFGTSTTQFLANNGTWQTISVPTSTGFEEIMVGGDSIYSDDTGGSLVLDAGTGISLEVNGGDTVEIGLSGGGIITTPGAYKVGCDEYGRVDIGNALTASDVGAAASTHSHGDITSGGDITTTATIASGDRLVINDESASKITNSSIIFDTSTSQFLANNGTWQNVSDHVSSNLSSYTNDVGYIAAGSDAASIGYNKVFATTAVPSSGPQPPATTSFRSLVAGDLPSIGSITNAGAISSDTTVASGDKIVITDDSDSSKIKRSSISFGSSTTQFLANNGTWQTVQTSLPIASSSVLGGIMTTDDFTISGTGALTINAISVATIEALN